MPFQTGNKGGGAPKGNKNAKKQGISRRMWVRTDNQATLTIVRNLLRTIVFDEHKLLKIKAVLEEKE